MKKTLLASAIAAVTFSGGALAQTTASASELAARMDSMPTVYGNIQYVVAYDDFDGESNNIAHQDNGSTIGIQHEHSFAPGLTGFFKVELEGLSADDKDRESGLEDLDEAYIGIKGDSFGQLWVGSDDSMYETSVEQISQFYERGDLNRFVSYDTGEGDLIQYKSPSLGGLTLGGAVQINGDGDDQSLGDKNNKKSYPFQLAAMYEVDALELAVAVDSNDSGTNVNNENTYGLRSSFNLDNLRLTAEYHTRKDVEDTYGVQGIYALGSNQFALSYEVTDQDFGAENKIDVVTLQALHNLSDHMYIYFEGLVASDDESSFTPGGTVSVDRQTQANVGAVYYF